MKKVECFRSTIWKTVYNSTYSFLELLTTWSKSSVHKSICSELWDLDVSDRLLLKNDVNVSSFSWGTTTVGRQCVWSWSTDRSVKQLTVDVTVCNVFHKQVKETYQKQQSMVVTKKDRNVNQSQRNNTCHLFILSILIQFNPHIWISSNS